MRALLRSRKENLPVTQLAAAGLEGVHDSRSVRDAFGRNTTEIPSGNIQWSPRLGFNWNVTGDDANQLRGGAGLFTGRPAFVWLSNAFQNSGSVGVGVDGETIAAAPATSGSAPRIGR